MTMSPRYNSADPRTRKLMYYVCDKTGKCFSATEVNALAGSSSTPIIDSLRNPKSRLDKELDLSEILLGEKKPNKEQTDKDTALVGSTTTPVNRLNRNKSLSELLGVV